MFVVDTHALVGYLLNKLPKKADDVFQESERGEFVIFVPTIVLAELNYLIKDERIKVDFNGLIEKIESSDNFISVPLNLELIKLLPKVQIKEIHDQIIVATAKYLNCKLVTKDEDIKKSRQVDVVWD